MIFKALAYRLVFYWV